MLFKFFISKNTTINFNYKQKKWNIIRIEKKNSKKLQNRKNQII
jgi:hypothetical protein